MEVNISVSVFKFLPRKEKKKQIIISSILEIEENYQFFF